MLLEFKVKNYKVFKEETIFSMKNNGMEKSLDYSLLKEAIGGNTVTALCSSVIYGSNASGKTNLLGAMDTFRTIVLRGHIKNVDHPSTIYLASSNLELIPNQGIDAAEPVAFSVEFTQKNHQVLYIIELNLGTFGNSEFKREVRREELIVDGQVVFSREKSLTFGSSPLVKELSQKTDDILQIAEETLTETELFLTNGCKILCSKEATELVLEWLMEKLSVNINIIENRSLILKTFNKNEKFYIDTMNQVAKEFGCRSSIVGYRKQGNPMRLTSSVETPDQNVLHFPVEIFESSGSVHFLNLFPILHSALAKGRTLIMDNFDSSLHSMAVMSLINVFHNNEINVNGAQLIFSTHNPIYMNRNLFRCDEMKFVERDPETHESSVYSLSDFNDKEARKSKNPMVYMNNYLMGRYGAREYVDFSGLFEETL